MNKRDQKPDLWKCPTCGALFSNANQWHSCGVFPLNRLFERSEPFVRSIFDLLITEIEKIGPVTFVPQRTRIAVMVRMRFAALMPQRTALKGHLVMAERFEEDCFDKIESYSRSNHVDVFRLRSAEKIDDRFRRFLKESYRVGCQDHLID